MYESMARAVGKVAGDCTVTGLVVEDESESRRVLDESEGEYGDRKAD